MTRRFLTPLSIDHIDFNLENPSTYAEGRLWWNAEEGTLDLGMTSDVSQSVGMEFYMPPSKNNSGVLIPNGSFVMATGAQGDRITIAKAVSDGSIDPKYMIGIATTDIENGAENGLITTNGIVRDVNTSLWPVGTILYPNSSSAGMLSASAGIAPAIRTPIAIVLRQHAQTGRIYVRMEVGHNFGEIESNVKLSSLQDGEVLVYNYSEGVWENSLISGSGGGVASLTGTIDEVNVSSSTGNVTLSLPSTIARQSWVLPQTEIKVLDDISPYFNGIDSRFLPKINNETILITNQLRLLLTIDGIIQEVNSPDLTWLSDIPRWGFRIDNEGFIQFTEAPPAGSVFSGKIVAGSETDTSTKQDPFKAEDIILGV